MARKTIRVEEVKERLNTMLRMDSCTAADKETVICIMEWMLMKTENYKGYRRSFEDGMGINSDETNREYI